MSLLLKIAFAGLMALFTCLTMSVPNAGVGWQNKELARIVFWHLPCALICSAFLLWSGILGIQILRKGDRRREVRMLAAAEVGSVNGILTMLTGILFSKVQWGDWWNWDPRQTSFLLVLLIAGGFFALRAAFEDPDRRAQYSAAFMAASFMPAMLLIFVLPRVLQSLHPDVVRNGGMDPTYRGVFYSMTLLLGVTNVWLYRMRVSVGDAELAQELQDAELADRNHSSPPRVARPISLSVHD